MSVVYISKEKKQKIEEELEYLKNEGRLDVSKKLDHALSLGDLKENSEYSEAREYQAKIESRILEIESILKNHQIIKSHSADKVEIGVFVCIAQKGSSKSQEFQIVGEEESDMSLNKLSDVSPLGKTILGKKVGETFEFEVPSGNIVSYKVVSIK